MIFHVSWLYRISFTYNPTASYRHRIVEWPWIEFKWGLCYSRNLEIFSILMSPGVQSNLIVSIEKSSVEIENWSYIFSFFKICCYYIFFVTICLVPAACGLIFYCHKYFIKNLVITNLFYNKNLSNKYFTPQSFRISSSMKDLIWFCILLYNLFPAQYLIH